MHKVKQIKQLAELTEGYKAVAAAIDAVLSKTSKKQFNISAYHKAVMEEVYNYFSGDSELYRNYIVGSRAHEAHTDALIDVKYFMDNPNVRAPDARARLQKARDIIKGEYKKDKEMLLALVRTL